MLSNISFMVFAVFHPSLLTSQINSAVDCQYQYFFNKATEGHHVSAHKILCPNRFKYFFNIMSFSIFWLANSQVLECLKSQNVIFNGVQGAKAHHHAKFRQNWLIRCVRYWNLSNVVNKRFQAKREKYSNFRIIKTTNAGCNQILHSDRDHKIFVVGCPKIFPTNPKWRMAVILIKMDK